MHGVDDCCREPHLQDLHRAAGANENIHTTLHDPSFLDGNLLDSVAEDLTVVQLDRGDDGYGWRDDVRGVKTAPETNLGMQGPTSG